MTEKISVEEHNRLIIEFKGDYADLLQKFNKGRDEIQLKYDEEGKLRLSQFEIELNEARASGEEAKDLVKKKYSKLQDQAEIGYINQFFQLQSGHNTAVREYVKAGELAFSGDSETLSDLSDLLRRTEEAFARVKAKCVDDLRKRMTGDNRSVIEEMIGHM